MTSSLEELDQVFGIALVIDGIRSSRYSTDPDPDAQHGMRAAVHAREVFSIIEDHPEDEAACGIRCNRADGFHWKAGDPIIRFTSNGLEVT